MAIKNNFLVEKRNILNEIRTNNMSLQELRFFSIYLSKINPRDLKTRLVRFPLSDFQKIMELDRLKIDYLKGVTDSLLSKIVHIPIGLKGGYTSFQLFKKCTVIDYDNEWYIEIDSHDEALPLMFEFKEKYFSYQLWNALRLKSSNQLRMYEILKQYEKIGERILSIDEIKDLIGISKNEYKRFNNFKSDVLEVCKKSIEENTDIKFTYESTGKKGNGGKILNLKFKISKNLKFKDPLTLEKFIESKVICKDEFDYIEPSNFKNKSLVLYADAFNNEFSEEEVQYLYDLIIKILPYSSVNNELEYYDYFKRKYDQLNMMGSKKIIKSRFNYLKKLIEIDL